MARPVVSDLAEDFHEALGFHTEDDAELDYPLLHFVAVLVAPLEPIYEIVRERDDSPPWGVLFDVDECPAWALLFLSQFPGVLLEPGMTEEQQRDEIRAPTGWKRGQPEAIRIAGQRTLTGTKRIVVRPRTPVPGVHYIRTLKSETPDEERTRAALRAALPPWEVLDYEAFDGPTYTDADAAYADYDAEDEAVGTYTEDLESTLP